MINEDRWISSLPKINTEFVEEKNQLDYYRWTDTIPKKKKYNSVKQYSLTTILFVCGLLFVSAIKNETRNLQKEINNLKASNNLIKFNLDQAILDNEVIISPANLSKLAKEYLDTDFVFYQRSQIKNLYDGTERFTKLNQNFSKKKIKKLSTDIKSKVITKIEDKKTEIRKLQKLYSKPKEIPGVVKMEVAKKINKKKTELKDLYTSPKETISFEKIRKWTMVQVVKVFLGIPVIPGR